MPDALICYYLLTRVSLSGGRHIISTNRINGRKRVFGVQEEKRVDMLKEKIRYY